MPNNQWEAVGQLVKIEQHLISALHIMESVIEHNGDEYWEHHEKRIKEFISQFQ